MSIVDYYIDVKKRFEIKFPNFGNKSTVYKVKW